MREEIGHRVDFRPAQPLRRRQAAQLRRYAKPILFGVPLGQSGADVIGLRFTREAGQIGGEQAGANSAEKREGCVGKFSGIWGSAQSVL